MSARPRTAAIRRISAQAGRVRAGLTGPEAKAALKVVQRLPASCLYLSQAVSSGSGPSSAGRSKGSPKAPMTARRLTRAAMPPGFEVCEESEFEDDRDDGVPGGGERGEGGEFDRCVGAGGGEPAQALGAVGGESEEGGECAADEDEPLEAGGGAVVGEVPGEGGAPGPGEERGDDGECAAGGGQRAGRLLGEGDEPLGRCGGLHGVLGVRGVRGDVRHGGHTLSATRWPSRPCGRKRSTRMRSTNAQVLPQDWPPSCSKPGMSAT